MATTQDQEELKARKSKWESETLNKLIDKHNINAAFITTALCYDFFKRKDINNPLLKLDYLLFGGEKAPKGYLKNSACNLSRMNIIHVYGPTEAVVFATKCYLNTTNIVILVLSKADLIMDDPDKKAALQKMFINKKHVFVSNVTLDGVETLKTMIKTILFP